MNLGKRVQMKLDEMGKSQRWLARQTNITHTTIAAIIQRDSYKTKYSEAFAKALGVSEAWLINGREENDEMPPAIRNYVPLLDWKSAANYQSVLKKLSFGNYGGAEWVATSREVSSKAFALKVKDKAMEPTVCKDYLILVDPDIEPKPNSLCVFSLPGVEQVVFKRFILDANKPYLESDNKRYDAIPLPRGAKCCGVVLGAKRYF
jgi:SOS-response transcriptional repressor LexA